MANIMPLTTPHALPSLRLSLRRKAAANLSAGRDGALPQGRGGGMQYERRREGASMKNEGRKEGGTPRARTSL